MGLVGYSILQIRLYGINVKDFWSFIEANQMLDKLYNLSRRSVKMAPQEQLIYLKEAEKIFEAFDKIPNELWDDEYNKYTEVLNRYRDIKLLRWSSN